MGSPREGVAKLAWKVGLGRLPRRSRHWSWALKDV